MNTHEYLLQGSIIDSAVDTLSQRIKGLADPKHESFHEQEMVFALKAQGGCINQLHLRFKNNPEISAIYHMRYVGNPEPENVNTGPFPVMCRKVIESFTKSNDMMNFIRAIGFRYEYGYVREGKVFTKGHLKITVAKISKTDTPGDSSQTHNLTNSQLVEISTMGPPGDLTIAKALKDFADQLRPLVRLEKMDYHQLAGQYTPLGEPLR